MNEKIEKACHILIILSIVMTLSLIAWSEKARAENLVDNTSDDISGPSSLGANSGGYYLSSEGTNWADDTPLTQSEKDMLAGTSSEIFTIEPQPEASNPDLDRKIDNIQTRIKNMLRRITG